jgi:N-acetylglucosaminyl-diphospho-decaprenol L-rhamnosyltransferase
VGLNVYMVLSVIIVNYNVKYFLEQCLYSVEKALQESGGKTEGPALLPATEVLVVDNHSSDDSIEYLQAIFPRVRFIANQENLGFARANNQALLEARGQNILFLNPDTILPEDFFGICLSFMRGEPGAGALGVRMVDGSGRFLKESRRGFPTPWVAFCKLTGLTALMPHSRFWANYYLGHLPADRNHPAPILSGACMWVRREALDKAGSFDEQFFMYAEDIDLSHRIGQAGYLNYYIADTTILHFKGESTRKDVRYIKLFYKAMSQFRRKHFSGGLSALFNGLMEIAIWLRAGITAVGRGLNPVRWRRPKTQAGIGLPGLKANSERVRTRVTGDPVEADRLAALLSSVGERVLVPDEQEAEEIIFCEGTAFSFKDCIIAMQKIEGRISCKIHAAGSGSAAGSSSKEEQGQTIVLPEKGLLPG